LEGRELCDLLGREGGKEGGREGGRVRREMDGKKEMEGSLSWFREKKKRTTFFERRGRRTKTYCM